jgi:hypothetical protein
VSQGRVVKMDAFVRLHVREGGEEAFRAHAELTHTAQFLERVDALADQPREVGRMERVD